MFILISYFLFSLVFYLTSYSLTKTNWWFFCISFMPNELISDSFSSACRRLPDGSKRQKSLEFSEKDTRLGKFKVTQLFPQAFSHQNHITEMKLGRHRLHGSLPRLREKPTICCHYTRSCCPSCSQETTQNRAAFWHSCASSHIHLMSFWDKTATF